MDIPQRPFRITAACARCRKLKVKCAGPENVPCPRCAANNVECVFTAPGHSSITTRKLPQQSEDNQPVLYNEFTSNDLRNRVEKLEQQVQDVTNLSNHFSQQLQDALARISKLEHAAPQLPQSSELLHVAREMDQHTAGDNYGPSLRDPIQNALFALSSEERVVNRSDNLVAKNIITDAQCNELFSFYRSHCDNTIAFLDTVNPTLVITLQTPILIAAICTVGARASKSPLYSVCKEETEQLILQTLSARYKPDLATLKGIMIFAAWHRLHRMWGHILCIGYELGIHDAALSLAQNDDQSSETVDMARTWLSFCCLDLIYHLDGRFLISDIQSYIPLGSALCASKHFRTVDYRIMTYLKIFGIAAEAKAAISKEKTNPSSPLSEESIRLFQSFNQTVDAWFYNVSNEIDPLFQTFSRPQDRNRLLIPYAFVRMYINGSFLHNINAETVLTDLSRISFIQTSVESGKMLIRAALQSDNYHKALKYTIDYSGSSIILAINFLYKAILVAHRYIDVASIAIMFHEIVELFRGADANTHAAAVEKMRVRIAEIGNTGMLPESPDQVRQEQENSLYDIVGGASDFVRDPTWQQSFPLFDFFSIE